MYAIEKVRLMHAALSLSVPPPPMKDQYGASSQSEALPYVVQIEQKLGLSNPQMQLGQRIRAVEARVNPLHATKKQIVAFSGHYSAALCLLNPAMFFVFGDNMQRVGMGGQAVIRPQPNIIGVATKRDPGNGFMTDCPFDMGQVMVDLLNVDRHIAEGKRVVIPITKEGRVSLGCGLAELPYRAPLIYATIEAWFRSLKGVEYVK